MRRVAALVVLVLSALALGACADGAYTIEIDIVSPETREATVAIELALIAGGCDDVLRGAPAVGAAQVRVLRRDGARPSFAPTRGGRYGVYAVARDEQCVPLAAGCTEAVLEAGGRGTIVVRVEDVSAMACNVCDDGVCVEGDAGTLDAGGSDAGVPVDAGDDDAGDDDGGTTDGGTIDGGTIDGGTIDGGTIDGGPPVTQCDALTDVLFCHGFEPSDPMAWSGTEVERTGSSMTIVSDASHFGARSARGVTVEPLAQAAYTRRLATPIADGEALWLRGYYRIDDPGALTSITLAFFAGTGGTGLQARAGGGLAVAFQAGASEAYQRIDGANVPWARGRWVCIEARLVVDGGDGSVDVWADGAHQGALDGYDTLPGDGVREIQIGNARSSTSQGAITVWIDDVVLSRTRVGCYE